MTQPSNPADLRAAILDLVAQYSRAAHGPKPFIPGKSRVPYSGRVFDERELLNAVGSSLDFWVTAGPEAMRFERRMQQVVGSRAFLLVNSGSSANLLMVATLCSRELERLQRASNPGPLTRGDEVITPAVTFPTTLAPILQNGLVPVFVDCEIGTYNINPTLIEDAIGPRTRAILIPHTLGNPCDMAAIGDVCRRRGLWLLEDCCDALGATFDGQACGTFGAMASFSFYPAHQMTMGEGGGVAVNHPRLLKTAKSIRDWGRDCWCEPGKSDTCGKRFGWSAGELPEGYDHKYIYSNIGYNLKVTDLQAAIGLAQVDKLDGFVAARRRNFWRLYDGLRELEDVLVLPRIDPRANPSPFGFPMTLPDGVDRTLFLRHLEDAGIETRLVFGGNILRQPGFLHIERRVSGTLEQSDRIMRQTLFVGVYPGLTTEMVDYVAEQCRVYLRTLAPSWF